MTGRMGMTLAVWMCVAGCQVGPAPMAPQEAADRADAADSESAALAARLVFSLDRAPLAAVLERLADPSQRLAIAAARSAGRGPVRRDASKAQPAVDALAAAMVRESRPAVLAAQAAALANLLSNRQGLGEERLDGRRAQAALQLLAGPGRARDGLADVRATAAAILADWASPKPSAAQLGANVYGGPGWTAPAPVPPKAPRPRPYAEPLHTVPVIAHGQVHLGDLDGDGAKDYLVIDTAGPAAMHVRLTVYNHRDDTMAWSESMIGDGRPLTFPPGELADLDADGHADILFADRAGGLILLDAAGQLTHRGQPYRTLNMEPYFGGPVAGRLLLANLRGHGRRDLLLVRGGDLLALTGRFQLLWHVSLPAFADPDLPTLIADIDGDGRDEIIRGNVALDDDGRALWTWPRNPAAALAGIELAGNPACRVVLAAADGHVAGFDADGLLWEIDGPDGVRDLIAGRFTRALAGRRVGITRGRAGLRTGFLIDGLGQPDPDTLRRVPPPAPAEMSVPPPPLAEDRPEIALDPACLVADWDRDGVDEVWGVDRNDRAGTPGWFKWPAGPAVRKIAIDPAAPWTGATVGGSGPLVGLADVDGDGADELLYFQGKSLVIQRR